MLLVASPHQLPVGTELLRAAQVVQWHQQRPVDKLVAVLGNVQRIGADKVQAATKEEQVAQRQERATWIHDKRHRHQDRRTKQVRKQLHVWRSAVHERVGDGVLVWAVHAQKQVVRVLPLAVAVVVQVVAGDGVDQVLEGADLGALASSGVVRFQGAGARVGARHGVGVVGPEALEEQVELRVKALPRRRGVFRQVARTLQLVLQDPPAQHGLHHVGSVQAVHTVGAHHLLLGVFDSSRGHVVVEVVVAGEAKLDQVLDEKLDAVPAHLAALVVEIKVDVVHVQRKQQWKRLDGLLIGVLDGFFVAALVDQVDQVVFAVQQNLLVEMLGRGLLRRARRHHKVGLVAQVVDLGPVHGHRATCLQKGEDLLVCGREDLLGLVEVGHVAVLVDSTAEVSCSSPRTRAACDQRKLQRLVALEIRHVQLEVAVNDRRHEAVGARSNQLLTQVAVPPETGVTRRRRAGKLSLQRIGHVEAAVHGKVQRGPRQVLVQQRKILAFLVVLLGHRVVSKRVDLVRHHTCHTVAHHRPGHLVLVGDNKIPVDFQLDGAQNTRYGRSGA